MGAKQARGLYVVTGEDRPGLLAALLRALAEAGARLLDLEQISLRGENLLALVVEAPDAAACTERLERCAASFGQRLVARPAAAEEAGRSRWVATVAAPALPPAALAALAEKLSRAGANVERVLQLSEGDPAAVEFLLTLPAAADPGRLKAELLLEAGRTGLDLAIQRESLHRRSKRLVVMDMDSTLISIEIIDELARAHGVYEAVARITERAMRGELDFRQSLRERVAQLAGLEVEAAERLAAALPLSPGAETLTRVLRGLGFRLGVVSGGFTFAAEALRERLGLHHAFANVLEIEGGKLTGRVREPIVDAARKAEILEEIARQEGVPLAQTVAVGDGANDLLMLQRAGLGVAFRAKPKLREAAQGSITAGGLDTLLYILGLSRREIQAAEEALEGE